jgi:hypothetical protein
MTHFEFCEIADNIALEVKSKSTSKSMKVKTLLSLFKYEKRTEEITTTITELFSERNIVINPSIMKLGDNWQLTWEDRIYLSVKAENIPTQNNRDALPHDWNNDNWFDLIQNKEYRTEREVETKFIIPLLFKLGYSENDRFDGMCIDVCHGSKPTKLTTDFSLFNKNVDILDNQVLLVVEAKKDFKHKDSELDNARKQVKSYAVWLGCYFGLVTDGNKIQVVDLYSSRVNLKEDKILFDCRKEELKERFQELYGFISKDSLTKFYEPKIK